MLVSFIFYSSEAVPIIYSNTIICVCAFGRSTARFAYDSSACQVLGPGLQAASCTEKPPRTALRKKSDPSRVVSVPFGFGGLLVFSTYVLKITVPFSNRSFGVSRGLGPKESAVGTGPGNVLATPSTRWYLRYISSQATARLIQTNVRGVQTGAL